MSGVYVSLLMYRSGVSEHQYSTRAHDHDNTAELAQLLHKMARGEAFDRELLPRQLIRLGTEPAKRSVVSTGFILLDQRAAAVFRAHDLGTGFLWKLPVSNESGSILAEEAPWYGLHVGTFDDVIDPKASTAIRTVFGSNSIDTYALESGLGEVVLSETAAPKADVWRETALTGTAFFFLSQRLRDALETEGLATEFDLIACKAANERDVR